jgi:hypothetical protein
MPWYFPVRDGILSGSPRRGAAEVQVFETETDFGNRLLVGGCDPGISVLARHAQAAGIELVLAHRNSSQALRFLKNDCVHIAGNTFAMRPAANPICRPAPAVIRNRTRGGTRCVIHPRR